MPWKIREAYFNLKWDNGTILNPGTDPESLFCNTKQCWSSSTWYLPVVLPVNLDHTAAAFVNIFWQWSADKSKEVHNPLENDTPWNNLAIYESFKLCLSDLSMGFEDQRQEECYCAWLCLKCLSCHRLRMASFSWVGNNFFNCEGCLS